MQCTKERFDREFPHRTVHIIFEDSVPMLKLTDSSFVNLYYGKQYSCVSGRCHSRLTVLLEKAVGTGLDRKYTVW